MPSAFGDDEDDEEESDDEMDESSSEEESSDGEEAENAANINDTHARHGFGTARRSRQRGTFFGD
jgi:hypothetical protein